MSTRARTTRLVGLTALAGSALALTTLHVLEPGFLPLTATVSEYALSPHGWMMNVFFIMLALGSACLAALQPTDRPARQWLLAAWSAGTLACAVFPTDPGSVPTTVPGYVHSVAAMLAFTALFACQIMHAIRAEFRLPSIATMSGAVAGFASSGWIGFGAGERVAVVANMAWIAFMIVATARRHPVPEHLAPS